MDNSRGQPCSSDRFRAGGACKLCILSVCRDKNNLAPCKDKCPEVYNNMVAAKSTIKYETTTIKYNDSTTLTNMNFTTNIKTTNSHQPNQIRLPLFPILGYTVPLLVCVVIVLLLFLAYKFIPRFHRFFDDVWGAIKRCGNVITPEQSEVMQINDKPTVLYHKATTDVPLNHKNNNDGINVEPHRDPETVSLFLEEDQVVQQEGSGTQTVPHIPDTPHIMQSNGDSRNAISSVTVTGRSDSAAVHSRATCNSNEQSTNISHPVQGYYDVASQCNAPSKLVFPRGSFGNINKVY